MAGARGLPFLVHALVVAWSASFCEASIIRRRRGSRRLFNEWPVAAYTLSARRNAELETDR